MKLSMRRPSVTARTSRGAFILVEGIDRSGKSTQVRALVERLHRDNMPAKAIRFPDRASVTGKLLDEFLKGGIALPDKSVHLLFCANRWEAAEEISKTLQSGTHVICDRYTYSGQAYSMAKDVGITQEWARSADAGLPAPDLVVYLDLPVECTIKRSGFGSERYEKIDSLRKVQRAFEILRAQWQKGDEAPWFLIDATDDARSIHRAIYAKACKVIEYVATRKIQTL